MVYARGYSGTLALRVAMTIIVGDIGGGSRRSELQLTHEGSPRFVVGKENRISASSSRKAGQRQGHCPFPRRHRRRRIGIVESDAQRGCAKPPIGHHGPAVGRAIEDLLGIPVDANRGSPQSSPIPAGDIWIEYVGALAVAEVLSTATVSAGVVGAATLKYENRLATEKNAHAVTVRRLRMPD